MREWLRYSLYENHSYAESKFLADEYLLFAFFTMGVFEVQR